MILKFKEIEKLIYITRKEINDIKRFYDKYERRFNTITDF